MMRCFLAVVFAVLVTAALPHRAEAQCTNGLITNCPYANTPQADDVLLGWQSGQNPHTRKFPLGNISGNTFSPWLLATAYGVKADGTTSNDRALGRALYACSQAGATLVLPPGRILLTGAALVGTETRNLQNCRIQGSGVPAAYGLNALGGTTIEPTSTTVGPFVCGNAWRVSGLNFFWPNQNSGTLAYPPLITDNGSVGCAHGIFDHNVVMNAYDAIVQSNGVTFGSTQTSWGDIKFIGNVMWAVRDTFNISNTGDGFSFSGNRFEPGPWLTYCNFTCESAVNAGLAVNMLYHLTGTGIVTLNIDSSNVAVAYRYGIYMEATAAIAESQVNMTWDSTATLIDTSTGGNWVPGNVFGGNDAGCAKGVFGGSSYGHVPCFNMGAVGSLNLTGFISGGSLGSFIETAGTNIRMVGGSSVAIGGAKDGGDYYQVHVTAGTPDISIQDVRFSGLACGVSVQCVHVHGITTAPGVTPGIIAIQNNQFEYHQDAVNITAAIITKIDGNRSFATNELSTPNVWSMMIAGTNSVSYGSNLWDLPKPIVLANCGAGATVFGTLRGQLTIGSTNPTTACTLTLPFTPTGGGVEMILDSQNISHFISALSGNTVTFTFGSDVHGDTFWFDASGRN